MKRKACFDIERRRKIKNALMKAGVPINKDTGVEEDDENFNDDYDGYISNITRCDERCQSENKRNEILRSLYRDAKQNVRTAPRKKDIAEKKYYTTAYGQAEYNEILNEKYTSEIKDTVEKEKNNFNSKKEKLLLLLQHFDKNISLNNKLNELNEITLNENNDLIEKIEQIKSTINTNERKVYYDNQQVDNLKKWKKYTLRYLFILYALILFMIIRREKGNLNYKILIRVIILLLIPLLFIPVITRAIIAFYNWINNSSQNLSPFELLSKIALETSDEFQLFFGVFYAPLELLAL